MNEKDIQMLYEYLVLNEDVNEDDFKNLKVKITLIIKQIELNKKYQEDLEEINSKLVELNK